MIRLISSAFITQYTHDIGNVKCVLGCVNNMTKYVRVNIFQFTTDEILLREYKLLE